MKKSLYKHLFFVLSGLFLVYAAAIVWVAQLIEDPVPLAALLGGLSILVIAITLKYLLAPLSDILRAANDGVGAFKDGDFSLTIHRNGYREIENIAVLYNELAAILREERMNIFQRELLLDTVIQATPVAMVLTTQRHHIVYSNAAAKQLLGAKKKLEGHNFQELIQLLPPELQQASRDQYEGLVTQNINDQSLVFNVNFQEFRLNGRTHFLYLYKNLTDEMSRKEIELWKRVIRMISHELNNSLAPISSLSRSAKKIVAQPEHNHMLNEVLDTISNRTQHLSAFINQYAQFAKMPQPKKRSVELGDFCNHLQTLLEVPCEFEFHSGRASFDPAQLEQVLINLIKNARESGSDDKEIGLKVIQRANRLNFTVYDRGPGLSQQQIQQALLPFYTTKEKGSGIGLALCNEIVIAHGGKLRLFNRDHGGLCVSFELALDKDN